MRFTSSDAERRYAALLAVAGTTVVGLDFDGTLAPIVDDPESAHIHPDAPHVLLDLSAVVRAVAVVTGRPARKVLALGGLAEVGREIGDAGRELFVYGQYGFEQRLPGDLEIDGRQPRAGGLGELTEEERALTDGQRAE